MKRMLQLSLAVAIAGTLGACATESQKPATTSGPQVEQAVVAADTVTLTAKVEAVDQAKRLVTLRGSQGGVVQVKVDPSVTRLNQVKVGDTVVVQYREAIAVEIVRGGGAPGESVKVVGGPAPGDKPAGGVAEQVRVTAKVTAVDKAKGRVQLQGPKGQVQSFTVKDQNLLRDLKVGDDIQVVYTEALAIAVEPAKAAKKK